jgi:outer membrane protein assembly factor BamB
MSTTTLAPPSRKRSFFRVWLPILIVGLFAGAVTALWAWPDPELERYIRVAFSLMATMLASLLLLGWWLVFSGVRWWIRLPVAVLVVAAGPILVRAVDFTGDMVPIFHWRWSESPDDVLEAHRRSQPRDVLPPIEDWAKPTDYPEYRGRRRDAVVLGPALARDWSAKPPRELWQPRPPIGGGYASFAVAGNIAVTIEQRRDNEAVVCYDIDTGRERWVHSYPAHFKELQGGPGPRATPTIAGDRVYSLGAEGMLVCLDAHKGEPSWSVNILEDNQNLMWGMSGSPLVYDDVVVVNPGAQTEAAAGKALVAYKRVADSPEVVWSAGNARAGYSSPMLATLAGRRQIVLFDEEGLAGYDTAGAGELWRFPWTNSQRINVAQPLILECDRVFISSSYGKGCAMLRVSQEPGKWSVKPLWQNRLMRCKFSSPVAYKGHLYGLDEGDLVCLNQETGQRAWRGDNYGHGQLVLADDLLVILSESGQLALVEATAEAPRQLGIFAALENKGGKTWNCPSLANGKLFIRNHREMACYDLR